MRVDAAIREPRGVRFRRVGVVGGVSGRGQFTQRCNRDEGIDWGLTPQFPSAAARLLSRHQSV
jgi:hypothetical protein